MIAAALAAAGAPVSSFFEAGQAVPPPIAVAVQPLAVVSAAANSPPAASAAPVQTLQRRPLHLDGRKLTLGVMRDGDAGTAVLSAAQGSLDPALLQNADRQFRAVVADVSGCRLDGGIIRIAGPRGVIALSAALQCPRGPNG